MLELVKLNCLMVNQGPRLLLCGLKMAAAVNSSHTIYSRAGRRRQVRMRMRDSKGLESAGDAKALWRERAQRVLRR